MVQLNASKIILIVLVILICFLLGYFVDNSRRNYYKKPNNSIFDDLSNINMSSDIENNLDNNSEGCINDCLPKLEKICKENQTAILNAVEKVDDVNNQFLCKEDEKVESYKFDKINLQQNFKTLTNKEDSSIIAENSKNTFLLNKQPATEDFSLFRGEKEKFLVFDVLFNNSFNNVIVCNVKNTLTNFLSCIQITSNIPLKLLLKKYTPCFISMFVYNFFYEVKQSEIIIQNFIDDVCYIGTPICNSIFKLLDPNYKCNLVGEESLISNFKYLDSDINVIIKFLRYFLSKKNTKPCENLHEEVDGKEYLFFKSASEDTVWYKTVIECLSKNKLLACIHEDKIFIAKEFYSGYFSTLDFLIYIYGNLLAEMITGKKMNI